MPAAGEGENGEWILNGYGVSFWNEENVIELNGDDGGPHCKMLNAT